MSVDYQLSPNGRELTIAITGRFDFNVRPALTTALEDVDLANVEITIDLGKSDYIDSSALGMLLILREKAGGSDASITLANCKPATLELLKMSKCDELFEVN